MSLRPILLLAAAAALALGAWTLWDPVGAGPAPAERVPGSEVPPPVAASRQGLLLPVDEGPREDAAERELVTRLGPQPVTYVGRPQALKQKRGGLPLRILDRASGLPIEGVRVRRVDRVPEWLGFSEEIGLGGAATDERGQVSVERRVRPFRSGVIRPSSLVLQGDGYATAVLTALSLSPRENGRVNCYMDRSAELRGKVAFETPLKGRMSKVRLRGRVEQWPSGSLQGRDELWLSGSSYGGDLYGDGIIGPGGEFTVKDIPPGHQFRVEILSAGEVVWTLPEPLSFASGEARSVDWNIAPLTVRVHGVEQGLGGPRTYRLALEPAPLDRAWGPGGPCDAPQGTRHVGRADSLGVITFQGVLPGRWRATVLGEGAARKSPTDTPLVERPAPSFVEFTVEPQGGTVDVELPLYRGAYVAGTMRGDEGVDLSKLELYAEDAEGHRHPEGSRGPEAPRFRIGPLIPGEYDLGVLPSPWGSYRLDSPVKATAGGELVRVHLRKEP